jgi:hypothetical protein
VDWDRATAAMHELAHSAGFMREDEASFITYLAGRNSGEPELMYATYVYTFRYLINHAECSYALQEMYDLLPAQILHDLWARSEFWWSRWHRVNDDGEIVEDWLASAISDISTEMNEVYLQAQGQEGIVTYGRMVDLLFAWELGII